MVGDFIHICRWKVLADMVGSWLTCREVLSDMAGSLSHGCWWKALAGMLGSVG